MKVCAQYSGYFTQNSYVSSRVLKKTSMLVAILFFVTRDLNVRIQLGKQLFWIQHIQIMYKCIFTNFSPKMPTTLHFIENWPSLLDSVRVYLEILLSYPVLIYNRKLIS